MAVGVAASNAQTTYSQNIVGYANVQTLTGGNYYLLTIPFAVGSSNGANEVFGTTLPDFSVILTWNAVAQSYTSTIYDSTGPNPAYPGNLWWQSDDFTPAVIPTLPVGQGFFLQPYMAITNTFAGTIPVNVGTSNQMTLPVGGNYYLVASAVPYAGIVTNGNNSTGGPNLNGLPDFSVVLKWNATSQSYISTIYDSTGPNPSFPNNLWWQSDDFTPALVPTINVGEGVFVQPFASYTWTTGL